MYIILNEAKYKVFFFIRIIYVTYQMFWTFQNVERYIRAARNCGIWDIMHKWCFCFHVQFPSDQIVSQRWEAEAAAG